MKVGEAQDITAVPVELAAHAGFEAVADLVGQPFGGEHADRVMNERLDGDDGVIERLGKGARLIQHRLLDGDGGDLGAGDVVPLADRQAVDGGDSCYTGQQVELNHGVAVDAEESPAGAVEIGAALHRWADLDPGAGDEVGERDRGIVLMHIAGFELDGVDRAIERGEGGEIVGGNAVSLAEGALAVEAGFVGEHEPDGVAGVFGCDDDGVHGGGSTGEREVVMAPASHTWRRPCSIRSHDPTSVSYTHLRAHETVLDL